MILQRMWRIETLAHIKGMQATSCHSWCGGGVRGGGGGGQRGRTCSVKLVINDSLDGSGASLQDLIDTLFTESDSVL